MTVFLVRRYGGHVSPSWNEHPDKTFEEVCTLATDKIREGNTTARYEVIEMAEVRRAVVAAEIAAVEVTERTTPDA